MKETRGSIDTMILLYFQLCVDGDAHGPLRGFTYNTVIQLREMRPTPTLGKSTKEWVNMFKCLNPLLHLGA